MIRVAIDPDIKLSGIAYKKKGGEIYYQSSDIKGCLDLIKALGGPDEVIIYIEASWLIKKANFRKGRFVQSVKVREKMSGMAGRNQGYGIAMVHNFEGFGYKVHQIKPLNKMGMKKDGKWTPKGRETFGRLTGVKKGKINDDERDAYWILFKANLSLIDQINQNK